MVGPDASPPRRYTEPPRMIPPNLQPQDISRNMYGGYSNDVSAMGQTAGGASQLRDS